VPKSKRGKGKQARFNKTRQTPVNTAAQQQTAAVNPAAPAAPVKVAAAPRNVKAGAIAISPAEERGYVVNELKRIGLWAGVIVIILIILALVIKR
jgi:hypothetical protein